MKPREQLEFTAAYGGCALAVLVCVATLGAAFALGVRLTDLILRVIT